MTLRCLPALLVLSLSLVATSAHAGDSKAALEAFRAAQSRYEAKDYPGALESAKKALELSGSPNARLYVGRSLRELGRLAEAHFELERTLREARDLAEKDDKYAATRDAAAAEVALLDQKVGKVIVALVDAPAGTRVTLNGTPLDPSRLGKPVAVVPGDLLIRAQPDGGVVTEKSVEMKAGETQTVTMVLETHGSTESDAPPPVVESQSDAPTDQPKGGTLRTIGFVTAGVGVAGIAVFAIAGSMSSSKFKQVEDDCGGKRCTDPKYGDTIDSGKRLETIANVGLVVGGVGLLAGGAIILFGGPKSTEKTGSASVSIAPGSWSVGYARAF